MWINLFPFWGDLPRRAPRTTVTGASGIASHDELAEPDCAPTQAAPERSGDTPAERLAALNAEIDRKLREVNALNEQARKLSREIYRR